MGDGGCEFNLEGTYEHKVQTDVVFKLNCSKNGQPVDVNYKVEAKLVAPREEIRGDISYRFGVYNLKFFPRTVGLYEMHIKINGEWLYQGKDVTINIVDQKSKKTINLSFEFEGELLDGNIKCGNPYPFIINVQADYEPYDIKESELEIRTGSGNSLQTLKAQRVAQGKYQLAIDSPLPISMPIDVFYDGKSVLKEPIYVKFTSPSDPKNTKACQVPTNMVPVGEVSSFFIQSRNRNDLNNTTGGDQFEVQCDGPAELQDLEIRDNLNGKYTLKFTPVASGVYVFNITLNGTHIGNSPVSVSAVKK